MEKQRAAVHFDGAGQQAAEVVDVPVQERWMNEWMVGATVVKRFKGKSRTCSVKAAEMWRPCPHRTFSSPVW